MILEINNTKAGIEQNITQKAKQLLHFSLARFEGVVTRVKVRFFDVNGPKGGIDKRCRISAKLNKSGQLIVLGEGNNYLEALNGCLDRLVRSTRREIEKRHYFPLRQARRAVLKRPLEIDTDLDEN